MNSFGSKDARFPFEFAAGCIASPRSEARSVLRNQFERGLTAIEVLADLLTVVIAVITGYFAYQLLLPGSGMRPKVGTIVIVSFAIAGLMVLLLDREGAYLAGNSLLRIRETERSLRVPFQAFLLLLPASFLNERLFPRWFFVLALLSVTLFQIVEKQLLFFAVRAFRARGFAVQNVLIYGAGDCGRRVFSSLIQSPKWGLKPVAIVDDDPQLRGRQVFESSYTREHSVPVIAGSITRELIERLQCELVVIAIPNLDAEKFSDVVHAAQSAEAGVAFLPQHSTVSDGCVEYADIDGIMFNIVRKQAPGQAYEFAKRCFDFISAAVLILALAPVLVMISILVHFDSPGGVVFPQERVGRNGRVFSMYKFRSMRFDVPRFAVSPRSASDPRITNVGRFLRRTSLDELPQLLNVLKGDMSLVGPRPEMPFLAMRYNSVQQRRLDVTPGITGLWQLSADRAFHIHENIQYDLYYVRHRSFFMDVAILLHTMVFAMRGV